MLCVFTLLLTACGKDDNDNSMDARLCRTWIEEYTEDNITYTHQLIFTQAGYSGQELKKKYDHTTSTANTETRDFTWKWKDSSMECLVFNISDCASCACRCYCWRRVHKMMKRFLIL